MVLTEALGQKVLDELSVVANMQYAVDARVHQVLLLVAQILADILRDKHDVSLHVDHEEEAVQRLVERERKRERADAKMNTSRSGSRRKRQMK